MLHRVLRFIGSLGKGGASIFGAVLAALGVSLGGGNELKDAVNTIMNNLPALISAVGVVLAAFGVGRKAGYVAGKDYSIFGDTMKPPAGDKSARGILGALLLVLAAGGVAGQGGVAFGPQRGAGAFAAALTITNGEESDMKDRVVLFQHRGDRGPGVILEEREHGMATVGYFVDQGLALRCSAIAHDPVPEGTDRAGLSTWRPSGKAKLPGRDALARACRAALIAQMGEDYVSTRDRELSEFVELVRAELARG